MSWMEFLGKKIGGMAFWWYLAFWEFEKGDGWD